MSNAVTRVIVRTGGFKIIAADQHYSQIKVFLQRMHQFQMVKRPRKTAGHTAWVNESTLKAVWYTKRSVKDIVVHHSYLEEFKAYFKHLNFVYDVQSSVGGAHVDIPVRSGFKPRAAQVPFIEFMSNSDNGIFRTLGSSTGSGKTVTYIVTVAKLKMRSITYIPAYLRDNWLGALEEFTDLEPDDILYISGKASLIKYMEAIMAGVNRPKVVLMSIPTMRSYISTYVGNEFPLSPMDFLDQAEFGITGVDEAHTNAHFHMITSALSNCRQQLYLSATINKEDEFLSDIQRRTMPVEGRCPVPEPSNHIEYIAYRYTYQDYVPKFKGAMGYQHTLLEGDIYIHPSLRSAYYLMMARVLFTEYMSYREDGQKALIYFATKVMVNGFAEFLMTSPMLKGMFASLSIVVYKAGDPESVIEDADIIVSTTKKAGTGVDLSGLITVVQTISISDKGEVMQNCGRLRNLGDVATRFIAVYSTDVPKQCDYQAKRLESLNSMVHKKSVKIIHQPMPTPTYDDKMEAAKATRIAKMTKSAEKKRLALKRGKRKKTTAKIKRFSWASS